MPDLIADDGDLRDLAALGIAGLDEPAEERLYAEDGVIVSCDGANIGEGYFSVYLDVEVCGCGPAGDTGKGALLAIEFGEDGIGDRDS